MVRSDTLEFIDDTSLPLDVVHHAYREMARVQLCLGNISAIVKRLKHHPASIKRVLDVGCGHGALLERIRDKLALEVIGVDLRPMHQPTTVPIVVGDATKDPLPVADVAVSLCLAHHLSPDDIVRLVQNVSRCCRRFILVDLVRHHVPLALFRMFVYPLLPTINAADGLTSIRRAYTGRELGEIVGSAVHGSGARVEHSVAPFFIRQTFDIYWPT